MNRKNAGSKCNKNNLRIDNITDVTKNLHSNKIIMQYYYNYHIV